VLRRLAGRTGLGGGDAGPRAGDVIVPTARSFPAWRLMFDDIYIVSARLKTRRKADVAAVSRTLGVTFPRGYGEFVTQFGAGTVNNDIRITMPDRIPEETQHWQDAWASSFWDDGRRALPKNMVLESIPIGDTVSGHQIIFHPAPPVKIFVLPHSTGRIYVAGDTLEAAIDWYCTSGKVQRRQRYKYFEACEGRAQLQLTAVGRETDFRRVRAALLALEVHDLAADEPAEVPLPGEEEGGPSFQLYVRAFSGWVQLTDEGDKLTAAIVHTGPRTQPKLRRLLTCLKQCGFGKNE
jgi:hypothetical protein